MHNTRRMMLLSVGLVAMTSAEISVGRMMRAPDHGGGDDTGKRDEAETRQGAAAAGGYDAPRRPDPEEGTEQPTETDLGLTPDLGAVRANEDVSNDDIDAGDGDRITTQAAREASGPFTGTGNQDAMRTSGRQGGTDAHHADERTSSGESAVGGAAEGGEAEGQAAEGEADESGEAGEGEAGEGEGGENADFSEGGGGDR